MLFGVFQQLAAQLTRQKDGANLALEGDFRLPGPGRLHGEVFDLADPDAGGADGLDQQGQPRFPPGPCRGGEGVVVGPGQVPAFVPEHPPLESEELDPAVLPAQEAEQAVEGGQRPVDGGGGAPQLHQMGLPLQGLCLRERTPAQPAGKGPDVPEIFFDGGRAFLLQPKVIRVRLKLFGCQTVFIHAGTSLKHQNITILRVRQSGGGRSRRHPPGSCFFPQKNREGSEGHPSFFLEEPKNFYRFFKKRGIQ